MNSEVVTAVHRSVFATFLLVLALAFTGCGSSSPPPQKVVTCGGAASSRTVEGAVSSNLTQMSSDPYTVCPAQHATEVEPHMIANGSMLVAAYQTGRMPPPGGGSTDIGWATSTDGGTTWQHGFLPGLTVGEGTGPYNAMSDPVVAYDAKHGVWMIASLPIFNTGSAPAVVVSRSTDGITWLNPVSVDTTAISSDKNWIVCDNWIASPFYGNCYMEWDDPSQGLLVLMSTSSDGGLTWGTPTMTTGTAKGLGGQPLVQPNGTVVVPIFSGSMIAFHSTDGGATWTAPITITIPQYHTDAGGIRSGPLPSAAIDGAGNVWVVWEDCRFRSGCATNDLVYSTSADGINWSPVTRIPIDDVSSTADYFIPGIGIDPATSGTSAHVAIHYYFYSQTNCAVSTCQLSVGYIASGNGGTTWNAPVSVAGPMQLTWLPNSQNGLMVGDYIATAFTNGVPHGVFAVANANSGTTFHEAMFTAQGLSAEVLGRQFSSANDKPMHNLSDPIEHEQPEKEGVPPFKRVMKSAR